MEMSGTIVDHIIEIKDSLPKNKGSCATTLFSTAGKLA